MIRYRCHACGQELESPTGLAGEMDTCPVCHSQTRVPSLEQTALKSAPRRKRVVLMIGIGLVLLSVVFHCIFCEWSFDYTHTSAIIPFSQKQEPIAIGGLVFNGIVPRHTHDTHEDLFKVPDDVGIRGEWKLLCHGFSEDELARGLWLGLVLPIALFVGGGLVLFVGWPKERKSVDK